MLFSLLKHYLDLYISDTALKVFWSLYCFITSISHGVENYFPSLWHMGISDAIFSTEMSRESLQASADSLWVQVNRKQHRDLGKSKGATLNVTTETLGCCHMQEL